MYTITLVSSHIVSFESTHLTSFVCLLILTLQFRADVTATFRSAPLTFEKFFLSRSMCWNLRELESKWSTFSNKYFMLTFGGKKFREIGFSRQITVCISWISIFNELFSKTSLRPCKLCKTRKDVTVTLNLLHPSREFYLTICIKTENLRDLESKYS